MNTNLILVLKQSSVVCVLSCILLGCQTANTINNNNRNTGGTDANKTLTVENLVTKYKESPENVAKEYDGKEITMEGFDLLNLLSRNLGQDKSVTIYLQENPDRSMDKSNKIYCNIPANETENYLKKFEIQKFSWYKVTVKGKVSVYSKDIGIKPDGTVSVGTVEPCEIVSAEFVKQMN